MRGKIFGWMPEGVGLKALEIGQECLPDVATEGKFGEFALAFNKDEAGCFELVKMVRKRGGRDREALAHVTTRSAVVAGAEALDDFHAARVA